MEHSLRLTYRPLHHSLRLPNRPLQLKNREETKKKTDSIGFLLIQNGMDIHFHDNITKTKEDILRKYHQHYS